MIKVAASKYLGQVAQLVEHGPEKAGVGGSSPPLTTFLPTSGETHPKKLPKTSGFCGFFVHDQAVSPRLGATRLLGPDSLGLCHATRATPIRMLFASFLTFFPADWLFITLAIPQPKSVPTQCTHVNFSPQTPPITAN